MIQISQRALTGSLPLPHVCSLEGGLAAKTALPAFEFAVKCSLHCRGGWSRVGWRRCSWAALNYNLILIAMQSGPLYNRQISVLSEGQSNPPKFLFTWLCSTRRILPDSAKIPACVACIGYFFLEFCCNQFTQTLWLYVLIFADIHVIDSIDYHCMNLPLFVH